MRNGSGDEFQILFSRHGSLINGFAHESEMSNWIEKEIIPVTIKEKLCDFFGQKNLTLNNKFGKV